MEKNPKYILVTWDFTEMSENALEHAMRIAKYVNTDVMLVHVVEEGSQAERLKDEASGKLDLVCTEAESKHGIKPTYVVVAGSIFSAISKYASENNVQLAVMGTHGIRGMQKITGSWALKVILGSKVPFLVVQEKPTQKRRYTDIVFPIDFKSESKEKLFWAIYLGKYFSSRIHLFKAPSSDQSFQKKINTNLNFAIRFLRQNDIEYEIHTAKKASNFAKETLAFAEEIDADMILIMTSKNVNVSDFFFGLPEQYVISNSAKIPVMCVNPREGIASVHQVMY
jgi:nucleotide-binding universal stress UspA family protein